MPYMCVQYEQTIYAQNTVLKKTFFSRHDFFTIRGKRRPLLIGQFVWKSSTVDYWNDYGNYDLIVDIITICQAIFMKAFLYLIILQGIALIFCVLRFHRI